MNDGSMAISRNGRPPPANSTGSNRSRDHLATSAPNTAETTPPASTSEIAFERNASSAISAAAKRYCCAKQKDAEAEPLETAAKDCPGHKHGTNAADRGAEPEAGSAADPRHQRRAGRPYALRATSHSRGSGAGRRP